MLRRSTLVAIIAGTCALLSSLFPFAGSPVHASVRPASTTHIVADASPTTPTPTGSVVASPVVTTPIATATSTPTAMATPTATPTVTLSATATPTPTVTETPPFTAPATAGGVISTAERFVGSPYAARGDEPAGFSCIGFVHFVFAHSAITVTEELNAAYASAPHIAQDALKPGDLVFFKDTGWLGNSHVSIYIGHGRLIGADSFQTGVEWDTLSDPYWQQHYLGATRPLANPSGTPLYAIATLAAPLTNNSTTAVLSVKVGGHAWVRTPENVYSGPDESYDLVATVTPHMLLTVVKTQSTWVNVSFDQGNSFGWVQGTDLVPPAGRSASHTRPRSGGPTATPLPTPHQAGLSRTALKTPGQAVARLHFTHVGRYLIVHAGLLTIRARPEGRGRVVRHAWKGDRLRVLYIRGHWYHVVLLKDKTLGWVDGSVAH